MGKNKYTTSDIAVALNVTLRTAQRYLETLVVKENGRSVFDEDLFNLIIERHKSEQSSTESDINEMRVEYFTPEEYEEFHKRLAEYPFLKERIESVLNDMEYYRKSMGSKERQMELLLLAITNRRFIEE